MGRWAKEECNASVAEQEIRSSSHFHLSSPVNTLESNRGAKLPKIGKLQQQKNSAEQEIRNPSNFHLSSPGFVKTPASTRATGKRNCSSLT